MKIILRKAIISGLKLGSAVGVILTIIDTISTKKFDFSNAVLNLSFSLAIATSISFFIEWIHHLRKQYNIKNVFLTWFLYYLAAFIGMTIASESGLYILYTFVRKKEYHIFSSQSQLLMSLVISLIVVTIVGIYQSQRSRLELKIKEKELSIIKLSQLKTQAELQTLQSRINPHFLYNSLNSIASLIHIDADKAEDMTLKLSKLFRYSINTQNENLTSVKEEVEIVKTYLDIEKVRFGNHVQFIFEVEEEVLNFQIPRFILQPLVENALKHGLSKTQGIIKVSILNQPDYLELKVHDNGTPFPKELNSGYGLQSTFDKLSLLYQQNYELHILNQPEKQIRITIPKSV